MERARRKEMTFEEEATFYQQEASKLFATEKGDSEAPIANNIVRRGMRIIRKAREEIAALREQEQKSPCSLCGYGGKHLDSPPCTKCPAHPKEQETVTNRNGLTNADRIRAMSDEELATFIYTATRACNSYECESCPIGDENCPELDKWLQQPCEAVQPITERPDGQS